jgi:hypothetical protein
MGSLMGERSGGEVILYEAPDGEVRVDVRLERETVWLTQAQMTELFGRERSVITKHIRNIFKEGELEPASVRAKFAHTAEDGKTYHVDHFNLDAILSVGYRVNSKRGTQFRIWATRTLREHLLHGYTLNERRLRERGLGEIEQAVGLLARTLTTHALVTDEGRAVLDVVQRYTRAWRLLLEFDEGRLAQVPGQPVAPTAALPLDGALAATARLREDLAARGEAGTFFGQQRGDGLAGILGAIEQTFDGAPLYPSAQARAAHLLYFVALWARIFLPSGEIVSPIVLRGLAGALPRSGIQAPVRNSHSPAEPKIEPLVPAAPGCDQGPSVHRRQQTHWHAAFSGIPPAQRSLDSPRRKSASCR